MIQIYEHTDVEDRKSYLMYSKESNCISSWEDNITDLFPVKYPVKVPDGEVWEEISKHPSIIKIHESESSEKFIEDHPEIFI